jgi:[acyl-carrier-protein] S-malonyltransferase
MMFSASRVMNKGFFPEFSGKNLINRRAGMEKYAFLFPGQGSQYPGMGKELADNFTVVRQTFEEADEALGSKLSGICFEGPESDLLLTENTQPALLAASTAFYRLIKSETGLHAFYFAGHSLGEYSALVAAGALGFADALVQLPGARREGE